MHVVYVNTILLRNTMSSILSLVHYGRCPEHFSKDYGWSSCKSKPLRTSNNTENSYEYLFIILKTLHSLMLTISWCLSINSNILHFLLLHKFLKAVHYWLMMGKDDKLAVVLNECVHEVSDAIYLAHPCQSVSLHKTIVIFLLLHSLLIKIVFKVLVISNQCLHKSTGIPLL